MRYKIFGHRTGLRVSELALGTGNFGTRWTAGAQPDECRAIFDAYLEAGGNFIDTADAYQLGEAEEILRELIAHGRDQLVIASKFSLGSAGLGSAEPATAARLSSRRSREA
jgi:aryl-alcohol dehydrogenase-like predicted oxidoreductase